MAEAENFGSSAIIWSYLKKLKGFGITESSLGGFLRVRILLET